MTDNGKSLILVTGATGFIALHTIKLLQEEGYRVRGTVRDLKNSAKVNPLLSICPNAGYPLELVEADLTSDNGWSDAVKDCQYVIHVASPFPNAPPNHEDDLIVPAVEGTKRVLQACANVGTIKRIVLTSSIYSVHGEDNNEEGRVYCEDDWSDLESPDLGAYAKSKTLAEKAAWNFIHSLPSDQKIELATINPGLVMGPSISGVVPTSLEMVKRLMDGSMPLIPNLYIAMCDVRDVALAHLRAVLIPDAASNRHLIVSEHLWLNEVADILTKEFSSQGYDIPHYSAPSSTLWLYSLIDSSTKLILNRLDKTFTFSNERMKSVLKIEARKTEETVIDTVYGLIDCGVLKNN